MSNEEINQIIAEWCGWKPANEPFWINPHGGLCNSCPDYCNDLNAIHGAEKSLPNEQQKRIYVDHLTWLMRTGDFTVMAPARQRAEALVRTIGKWKD